MRRSRIVAIAALLVGSFAFTGPATAEEARTQDVSPAVVDDLNTWYHSGRGDNYASGTVAGDQAAANRGYDLVRREGSIHTTGVSGTKPLWLYWHAGRGDNFTTATSAGRQDAIAAGYVFVRTEGHVYVSPGPNLRPLYTYWSSQRGDNFSAATAASINSAEAAGYDRVRIEGYVLPPD